MFGLVGFMACQSLLGYLVPKSDFLKAIMWFQVNNDNHL